MSGQRKTTVGDTRKALSGLTGIDPSTIQHYVIAIDTGDGTVLKFCCDDRRHASAMFASAAGLVLSVRGEPLHPDGPVPAMPEDN